MKIKYEIENLKEKEEEKIVPVKLKKSFNGDIVLVVGHWEVFRLTQDGKGRLIGGIFSTDTLEKEGLIVDHYGKLVLES